MTCRVDESGEEHCDEERPDPGPTTGMCMPPYFDDFWGVPGSAGSDSEVGYDDALDAATGGGNAHPTGQRADNGGAGVSGGSHGCQAVPGATGATSAVAWILPLLIGLIIWRRK